MSVTWNKSCFGTFLFLVVAFSVFTFFVGVFVTATVVAASAVVVAAASVVMIAVVGESGGEEGGGGGRV